MPMHTKFINFIVPISIIKAKYNGGFDAFLRDYESDYGIPPNYDEDLFVACAMNPMDIEQMVNYWTAKGFKCSKDVDGVLHWNDVCVFEEMFGGATMPCDWIGFNEAEHYVFLKKPGGEEEVKPFEPRGQSDGDALGDDDELQAIIHYGKYKPRNK
jgi:hypothetical protein